ncbi:MAG: hypothetical protein DMG14_07990 [Acidobacteria bacterium]|nr:MAG: hypothetical protein DMG14_07990 [Acidobacteriota bacterium]
MYPENLQRFVERLDFGPGCRIQRVFAAEDPNTVRYSITIWNALNLEVIIAGEDELKKSECKRPEGLDPSEIRGMHVSQYLRNYQADEKGDQKGD